MTDPTRGAWFLTLSRLEGLFCCRELPGFGPNSFLTPVTRVTGSEPQNRETKNKVCLFVPRTVTSDFGYAIIKA